MNERDKLTYVLLAREKLGKPSFLEEVNMLLHLGKMEELIFGILSDKNYLRRNLTASRQALTNHYGRRPSTPLIASHFIEEVIIREFKEQCIESLAEGNTAFFRLYFDCSHGMQIAAKRIKLAEDLVAGELEKDVHDELEILDGKVIKFSLQQSADIYLGRHLIAQKGFRSLRKDPTGIAVFDDFTEELRSGQLDSTTAPFQCVPYIREGVELAKKVYRKIYPLIE